MTLWAIVPVKSLDQGKTRLAGIFSVLERENLNRSMLTNILVTLNESNKLDGVMVISHDEKVRNLIQQFSFHFLEEKNPFSYNNAVRSACDQCRFLGATQVLILPADLPLFDQSTLEGMLDEDHDPPVAIIAPDRHLQGTNSLLINPLNGFSFHFGEHSFARHQRLAEELHYRSVIHRDPGTELDLDLPEDWTFYQDFVNIKSQQIGG
jgi:2-phospho-L-lactate/phosphoenolpyruvate guanylyltransferase